MLRIPSITTYLQLRRKVTKTQMNEITILFHSWVLYFLLDRVYREFLIKSRGARDSLGEKWKPLSESRRLYKPLQRGEVAPSVRRQIRERRVTKKVALANRNPPINIDTGRLINSLKPGRVIAGVYQSQNPDQVVRVTVTGISFEIVVPYADEVQAVRSFLPGNWDPWLSSAIALAVPQVKEKYQNVFL